MDTRKTSKKRNFSDVEIETITREVERNNIVLLGSLKSGIKGAHKNKIWTQITSSVNSVGVEKYTPAEVRMFYCLIYTNSHPIPNPCVS